MTKVKEQISQKWNDIEQQISNIQPKFQDELMDNELASIAKMAISEKLEASRGKGRGRWWSSDCDIEELRKMLKEHIDKGDMCDVMILSSMIYFKESVGVDPSTIK